MKIHEYNEMTSYLTRPAMKTGGQVIGKPGGLVEPGVTNYGAEMIIPKAIEYGPKIPGIVKKAKTFIPLIKKGAVDILNRLKNLPEYPMDPKGRQYNDLFYISGRGFRTPEWGSVPDMSKTVSTKPIEEWQSIAKETLEDIIKNKRGNLTQPDIGTLLNNINLKQIKLGHKFMMN